MLNSHIPSVNSEYSDSHGEKFTVIGKGTKGIIIEYQDGRVELVATPEWESLAQRRHSISTESLN